MAPEGRVVALGRLVVEDDEVADILIEVAHAAIIFVAFERADRLVGKEGEQALDADLDEVDARRFERFQKARRQTESDDIVRPADRKSVVSGKSVSVRVDLGGRRRFKKKKKSTTL